MKRSSFSRELIRARAEESSDSRFDACRSAEEYERVEGCILKKNEKIELTIGCCLQSVSSARISMSLTILSQQHYSVG